MLSIFEILYTNLFKYDLIKMIFIFTFISLIHIIGE